MDYCVTIHYSAQVKRLTCEKEYIFRVFAENRFGQSAPLESDPVLVRYPFNRPGAPSQPEVTQATRDSIALTWSPPTSDGGLCLMSTLYDALQRIFVESFFCFQETRYLRTTLKRRTGTPSCGHQQREHL